MTGSDNTATGFSALNHNTAVATQRLVLMRSAATLSGTRNTANGGDTLM